MSRTTPCFPHISLSYTQTPFWLSFFTFLIWQLCHPCSCFHQLSSLAHSVFIFHSFPVSSTHGPTHCTAPLFLLACYTSCSSEALVTNYSVGMTSHAKRHLHNQCYENLKSCIYLLFLCNPIDQSCVVRTGDWALPKPQWLAILQRPGFDPRAVHVGYVVQKLHVTCYCPSTLAFSVSCPSTSAPCLLSYHLGMVQLVG